MTYESLSKLFYKDSSSDRFERNAVLAEARRQADSSFLLGMKNENGEELFFSMPRELAVLSEAVLRRERRDIRFALHAAGHCPFGSGEKPRDFRGG